MAAGSVYSLARFDKDGRLDHSFGRGGQASTNVAKGHSNAVAIDSRNRIVVAGSPHFTLVRYRPNGKLNRSFGAHGKVKADFGRGEPDGIAIDSHDRPVAAGFVKRRTSARRVFAVARFLG